MHAAFGLLGAVFTFISGTTMRAYYNEFDPKAAAWLRELIANKLIADGDVDDRSITDVTANDLAGYSQRHFFAGIGGWSYALRLAGVPDDYPVWTASLPCQPFSAAGKQLGKADERHLLPHYLELVGQCKPKLQFGEQVERAIAFGWLDDLQANLEREGYTVGAAVLGAHSVGAPHIRQRLYWVADRNSSGSKNIERRSRQTWKNGWEVAATQYFDDGSYRRIPTPGFCIVANGVSKGVEQVRGFGNAIVPQVAAEFIGAFFDIQK